MGLLRSLSGRLLIVTLAVVMLAEIAIFVPSVARFREAYLMERVRRAEIAALTVLGMPDNTIIAPEMSAELLNRTARAERRGDPGGHPPDGPHLARTWPDRRMPAIDLRNPSAWELIRRRHAPDCLDRGRGDPDPGLRTRGNGQGTWRSRSAPVR